MMANHSAQITHQYTRICQYILKQAFTVFLEIRQGISQLITMRETNYFVLSVESHSF